MDSPLKGLVIALLAATCSAPFSASACIDPPRRTFTDAAHEATSIFVFKLEGAESKRTSYGPIAHRDWVQGRIRIVQTLKGNASSFKKITYDDFWCGRLRLDVGHYFLVATNARGDTIAFAPSDESVIDITDHYDEFRARTRENSQLLRPVVEYIKGKPLPPSFPPDWAAEVTRSLPPPPPPPKPKAK